MGNDDLDAANGLTARQLDVEDLGDENLGDEDLGDEDLGDENLGGHLIPDVGGDHLDIDDQVASGLTARQSLGDISVNSDKDEESTTLPDTQIVPDDTVQIPDELDIGTPLSSDLSARQSVGDINVNSNEDEEATTLPDTNVIPDINVVPDDTVEIPDELDLDTPFSTGLTARQHLGGVGVIPEHDDEVPDVNIIPGGDDLVIPTDGDVDIPTDGDLTGVDGLVLHGDPTARAKMMAHAKGKVTAKRTHQSSHLDDAGLAAGDVVNDATDAAGDFLDAAGDVVDSAAGQDRNPGSSFGVYNPHGL